MNQEQQLSLIGPGRPPRPSRLEIKERRFDTVNLKLAAQLRRAGGTLSTALKLYGELHPERPVQEDDGRLKLLRDMLEFAGYIEATTEARR